MPNELNPPIETDLGSNPGKVVFRTTDAVIEWAQAEEQAWRPAQQFDRLLHTNLQNALRQQVEAPQVIVSAARDLATATEDRAINNHRDAVLARLRQYQAGELVHHRSVAGRHILGLLSTNARRAMNLYAVMLIRPPASIGEAWNLQGESVHRHHFDLMLDGWFERQLLERGIGLPNEPAVTELKARLAEAADELNRLRADVDEAKNERATWAASMEQDRLEQSTSLDQFTENAKKGMTEFIHIKWHDFEALENKYRREVYTGAPRRYWNWKKWGHRAQAALWGVLFVLSIGYLLYASYHHANEVWAFLKSEGEKPFEPWKLTVLGVPLFLIFWILRLLHRLLTSNLALGNDAAERVTMVETFLALMHGEQKVVEEKDRILILAALFRPSGTSGGDEGTPPNWFDVLMQRIEKKSP